MKRVTHNDNLCTVGWTCITAWMDPTDMRSLLKLCPTGDFSQCFYAFGKTINTPELLENYERGEGIFYFHFQEDVDGDNLLTKLFDDQLDSWGRKYRAEVYL